MKREDYWKFNIGDETLEDRLYDKSEVKFLLDVSKDPFRLILQLTVIAVDALIIFVSALFSYYAFRYMEAKEDLLHNIFYTIIFFAITYIVLRLAWKLLKKSVGYIARNITIYKYYAIPNKYIRTKLVMLVPVVIMIFITILISRGLVSFNLKNDSDLFNEVYDELIELNIENNIAKEIINKMYYTVKVDDKLILLNQFNINDEAKLAIYKYFIASYDETSVIYKLLDESESAGNIYSSLIKIRTATEKNDLNESAVKRLLLAESSLTNEGKAYVYRKMLATEIECDIIDELYAEKDAQVYNLMYSLYMATDFAQIYSELNKSDVSDFKKTTVFERMASEELLEQFYIANSFGITINTWIDYCKRIYTRYADGYLSPDKAENILQSMLIPNNQKAVLWQLMNINWDHQINPFSILVGRQVREMMKGELIF